MPQGNRPGQLYQSCLWKVKKRFFWSPHSSIYRENLTSTTRVIQSVLDTVIKEINDNVYRYCIRHWNNGGPQGEGISFDQSYSWFQAEPTIRIIAAVASTYHLTISIANITNALHNNLKASYYRDIIEFLPHYISCFKLHFPTICIAPAPDGRYVMQICRFLQGTNPTSHHWNTIIHLVLPNLVFIKHVIDHDL